MSISKEYLFSNLLITTVSLINLFRVYFKPSLRVNKFCMETSYSISVFSNFIYFYTSYRDSYLDVKENIGYYRFSFVILGILFFNCLYFFVSSFLIKTREEETTIKDELLVAIPSYIVYAIVFLVIIQKPISILYFVIGFFGLLVSLSSEKIY